MCDHDLPDVYVGDRPGHGGSVWCDPCMSQLVTALIRGGFDTRASCCGHGNLRPMVTWTEADGTDRHIVVFADLDDALAAANPNGTDIHGATPDATTSHPTHLAVVDPDPHPGVGGGGDLGGAA